jgi:hypothetical protein
MATQFTPQLVQALAGGYGAIRRRHPELPDVLLSVETPHPAVNRRAAYWKPGPVITTAGTYEGRIVYNFPSHWAPTVLEAGPSVVFATLLHESAHALATVRDIKDCSRGGQYHNAKYRDLAIELGLDVMFEKEHGWMLTAMTPALERRYERYVGRIADLLPHASTAVIMGW